MSLILTGIGLAASAIGAGIKAHKNAQAEKMAEQNEQRQIALKLSDLYADPLADPSNVALLSEADRKIRKNNESIENMATAGGATFENTLAAKQAGNDTIASIYSNLLQGNQARRDTIKGQISDLESQNTARKIAAMQASGDTWAAYGNKLYDSASQLGGLMIENDYKFKDLLKW